MSIQGFRGNCDSQASWGCAPALPNRIQMIFPRQATGKKLFFRLRLVIYSQSSKKAAASSQEVAAFLQNIPKIKWFVAKLFYTFYRIDCQVKCNKIREKIFEAPRRESGN